VSFELPIREILGEENHFGISEIRGPEGIRDREFEDKPYELPVCEIALTVGSRGEPQPLISLGVEHLCFGILGFGIPGILMTRDET
jgi:hypothetical protein